MRKEKNNAPSAANIGVRLLIIGLPALIFVGVIGYMKLKSDERSPIAPQVIAAAERSEKPDTMPLPIAVPDTTIEQGILPILPDTLPAAPADSIGVDERTPHTAGREDGFLAGVYDREHVMEYGISYDDTNTFPTDEEQAQYSEGYRDGYAEGYGVKRPAAIDERSERE